MLCVWANMELPWNTQEYKDQMRNRRIRAIQLMIKLIYIELIVSFISIVCGILTIYFALPNPKFPFIFGGPIISGLPVFIACCIILYYIRNEQTDQEEVSGKIKCMVILHFVISATCISFSFISATFSGLSLAVCVSDGVTRQGERVNDDCLPNTTENIAMASVGIAVGAILGIVCIIGTCIFCIYGRAFGIKSRRQKIIEAQLTIMMANRPMSIQNPNHPGIYQYHLRHGGNNFNHNSNSRRFPVPP